MSTKRATALSLLNRTSSIFVHVDARTPGCLVPPNWQGKAHMCIQLGHNLPNPIPDLRFADDGISATLSFDRAPFATFIPWAAVKCMSDEAGQGVICDQAWFNEVGGIMQEAGGPITQTIATPRALHRSERSYLRRVK